MDAVAVLGVVATLGGVLLGLSPVMQMRVVVARRSAEGVSLGYWLVLVVAMGLWLAYGLVSRNAAIIVANTVSCTVGAAMIVVLLRYRNGVFEPEEPS